MRWREWTAGGKRMFGEGMETFATVPVCTSGRFLSSGSMKSRGKLRFKLAREVWKGVGRLLRASTTGQRRFLNSSSAAINQLDRNFGKSVRREKRIELLPQFFSLFLSSSSISSLAFAKSSFVNFASRDSLRRRFQKLSYYPF